MSEGTQRRLAAIVAADVVGYSRLMGVDEAGTLASLRAHRAELIDALIAEHGGRIVKTMGDGLLLEFPSVVDATQCMVEVQQGMAARDEGVDEARRITFRIGVNLGDIIIEGEDILGDGVNIAARLQEFATPGGIAISNRVHEDIRDRLDAAFEDVGEQSLKNIARPVRIWQWSPGVLAAPMAGDAPLTLPDKPSIAVLPFDNLSGDPEQEYFADGMTEDIITELSRFEDLFVIARNTTFTYKGQRVDVKAVAQELGVHFILEGSVRKAGQRVRITTQLIDGLDGGHVWAERYDGALEDVFELQEQVTSQVVGSISPHTTKAERAQIGQNESIFDDAYQLGWQARDMANAGYRLRDPAMVEQAIAMAIEAVAMNAKCGIAYQTVCFSHAINSLFRWGDDPSASATIAEEWAEKFLAQIPNSYMAYYCRGLARTRNGRYQEASQDFRRAHELNPNDSVVLRFWSWCEASAGDFEAAKEHAHLAIRLSPKDPDVHPAYLALAMAAFIERDNVAFEDWAGKAIQLAPQAPIRRAMMIAYAAEAGNQALLDMHLAELLITSPDFIDSVFRGENELFQKPEHTEILLSGLRKAGFPKNG